MVEMGEVVQRLSHCAVTQAVYGAIHKTDSSTGRHNDYLEVRQWFGCTKHPLCHGVAKGVSVGVKKGYLKY